MCLRRAENRQHSTRRTNRTHKQHKKQPHSCRPDISSCRAMRSCKHASHRQTRATYFGVTASAGAGVRSRNCAREMVNPENDNKVRTSQLLRIIPSSGALNVRCSTTLRFVHKHARCVSPSICSLVARHLSSTPFPQPAIRRRRISSVCVCVFGGACVPDIYWRNVSA